MSKSALETQVDAVRQAFAEAPRLWFEREDKVLSLERVPTARSGAGGVVGAHAYVALEENGEEVPIDQSRIIVNPSTYVVDHHEEGTVLGPGGLVRQVPIPVYRFDPVAAYLEDLWESIRVAPNPAGYETRGTVTSARASANSASITSAAAVYATMIAGGGTLTVATGDSSYLGQWGDGGSSIEGYQVGLEFDVSSIADTDVIASAVLTITARGAGGESNLSTSDFVIQCAPFAYGTLEGADWRNGSQLDTVMAAIAATYDTAAGYVHLSTYDLVNVNLETVVSKTGVTQLWLCGSRLDQQISPAGLGEYAAIYSAATSTSTLRPLLTVTHAAASSAGGQGSLMTLGVGS